MMLPVLCGGQSKRGLARVRGKGPMGWVQSHAQNLFTCHHTHIVRTLFTEFRALYCLGVFSKFREIKNDIISAKIRLFQKICIMHREKATGIKAPPK